MQSVRLLLTYKADPNVADNNRLTPLRYAVQAKSVDLVELLLKAGAYVSEPDLQMTERSSRIYGLLDEVRAKQATSPSQTEPK